MIIKLQQKFLSINQFVDRFLMENNIVRIPESGREISRTKSSFYNHTGIVLGRNKYTREAMILHNHPSSGLAIVRQFIFEDGNAHRLSPISKDDTDRVLWRAIQEFNQNKNYHFSSYNCQHFSTYALTGEYSSKAVNNTAWSILGLFIFSAINNSPNRNAY